MSNWSAPFVLQAGTNVLTVRALASDGSEIASEVLNITYTGAGGWPGLVINEWMASNQGALVDPADDDFDDWIELFNPDGSPVDLAGWFLSDDPADPFKFQVPAGFVVPAGGFQLVWADDEAAQNDPVTRPDLHVAFALSAQGESILLSAPDGTLIDRVDFGPQSPDKSMGQSGGEAVALASPSPLAVNGAAAAVPLATFTRVGNTLNFTVSAEPGFLYRAEASEDLLSWELLDTVLAEDATVEFSYLIDRTRRFYRFRRTP